VNTAPGAIFTKLLKLILRWFLRNLKATKVTIGSILCCCCCGCGRRCCYCCCCHRRHSHSRRVGACSSVFTFQWSVGCGSIKSIIISNTFTPGSSCLSTLGSEILTRIFRPVNSLVVNIILWLIWLLLNSVRHTSKNS
jgi:hypothetical protein